MNKTKAIIMAITLLLLVAAIILVARFIMNTVFAATDAINQLGEAPLPTEQIEEKWVAPALPPTDTFELERGIDAVEGEGEADVGRSPDADEELLSIPVEETAEELAEAIP